jgi:vacuolar protein sorting-associated protein VTA1
MAAVPPSLKKIKVFLTRAKELDRDKGNPESRVVAYNARQYAVLIGIPLAGQDGDAKTCLGELLNQLEKEKDAMSVFSTKEHWEICRKVADRVLAKADAEDRVGMATKETAKTFFTASNFYEILQKFYGRGNEEDVNADDETEGKRKEEEKRKLYCKWKATDILNAIKEGRTPAPGGYMEEDSENIDIPSIPPVGLISSSITQDLPPAPSMPSANFFNDLGTGEVISQSKINDCSAYVPVPPPAYDGFELDLNGDPIPVVKDGDDDSVEEDIFIRGSTRAATTNTTRENNIFFDDTPPPPYARTNPHNTTPSFPPSVSNKPLPPPIATSNSVLTNTGTMSPQYGKSSSSFTKLPKEKVADAIELTKFALAALQKGDSDMGKERLEQALALWRR